MVLGSRGSRTRCLVVWTVASGALALVGVLTRAPLRRGPATAQQLRHTTLDVALTDLAALVLLGCAVWLWAVTTVVVVTALWRAEVPDAGPRGVPAGVRRVVLAACGVALAGGLNQPSFAAGPHHHPARHQHHGPLAALSGLPLPDRAVATASPSPSPSASASDRPGERSGRTTSHPRTVLVSPGDSLWTLAVRDLPTGTADALVAAHWHAIYAANRTLIGPDPDVIVPGQRLRLPGKDPS